MFRFVGLVARRAVALVTRRILRDALASAIVTIVVTVAFTGFATRSEPPVPPQRSAVAAPNPPPQPKPEATAASVDDAMKVWLDPNTVAPNPKGFRRPAPVATASAHAPPRKRSVSVAARPSPPARIVTQNSRPLPLVLVSAPADDKAIGHRHAPDALASAAPTSRKRGFRVWGVAPGDLIPSVPSASSIARGVKSVGSSVVSWMPSL